MSGPPPALAIRVLVVDDEEPLRDALAALLSGEPGFEVVGVACDVPEALEQADRHRPDVALVDVRMPGGGGPAAAAGIRVRSPDTQVVALSAYEDLATVQEMLRAGAVGYMTKGVAPDEIIEALRRAARGQASISADILGSLFEELAADAAGRRDADAELRRSEEHARGLIETAPSAVVVADGDGRILMVNAQTEALFGYPRAELIGEPIEVLVPRRLRDRHAEHRDEYAAAPRTRAMGVGLPLSGRRRDGTEFPVDISLSAMETAEGLVTQAHVTDISARTRAEQRFAALLDAAPDAVAIIDEQGRIVLVNRQTEALFGYGRDELIGQPIEMLLPERVRTQHLAHRAGYIADPRPRPMGIGLELAGHRKDGSEFPIDISLSTIDTEDGRLAAAYIRDITERNAAEIVRRRSEQQFGALLESAPDGVVIADENGRIVLLNVRAEELFGYPRNALLGQPLETLLPERVRGRHVEHRAAYLADARTRPMGAGLDLAGRRRDGTEFPVDISLSTIETEQGRLLTAFVRDITERTSRAELERDLAERRALFAHLVKAGEEERRRIAEDIHDDSIQAITAAGMRLQILRRRLQDPDQLSLLSDLEQTIQLSITRLRHLLFELRPLALDNDGLSAAVSLYMDEAGRGEATSYRLDDRLTSQPLEETRVMLYRIVQEALTNARKHAQAEQVTVGLHEREGGYLVRVQDDGVGFSPEEAQDAPGHLGFASMRERAQLARGWLRIASAPGRGTTVEAWLPSAGGGDAGAHHAVAPHAPGVDR